MDEYGGSEARQQSEFNMAVSYLNRLNNWFYLGGESAMNLDAFGWFQALTQIFRELSTEMKEDEIKEKNEEVIKLNEWVVRNQTKKSHTKQSQIDPLLWLELHKFELFLRKVMKEAGLQTRMKEEVDIKGL